MFPGANALPWVEQESGGYGYRRSLAYGHMRIYTDGPAGQGDMVQLSGAGCRELEQSGLVGDDAGRGMVDLCRHVLDSGFHVARVDFAVDDRDGNLDLETVGSAVAAGHFTSKWHKGSVQREFDGSGLLPNHSVTFGSPTSDSRLRIYDKHAEQLEKGQDPGDAPWVRVELQLRNQHAAAMMRQIVDADGNAAPLLGVIRGHLDFKIPSATDSNKRRWQTAPWWQAFLDDAAKRRLGIGRPERSVEKTLRWIESQVAPALGVVVEVFNGDYGALHVFANDGRRRFKPYHLAMLAAARAA